ncbi:MAG: DNA-binding NarL/FixJ family response regulator [Saprospiraceae bacterium]|jgi:DNA-binding NarL/FixJ family response regulator
MNKHPVLICDRQYLSRVGLKSIIQKHPMYEVLGEVSTQEELETKLALRLYSVVTIDITVDGEFGLESISLIQEIAPKTNIVIISNEQDKRHIYEILGRGINHYITKYCREDEIFKALDGARSGEKYYCSKVLDIIINKTFGREKEEISELTEREKEIVQLIAQGKVAKEIAAILHISIHTIYTHRKNVMKKLGISSPVELITYAINKGLVEL